MLKLPFGKRRMQTFGKDQSWACKYCLLKIYISDGLPCNIELSSDDISLFPSVLGIHRSVKFLNKDLKKIMTSYFNEKELLSCLSKQTHLSFFSISQLYFKNISIDTYGKTVSPVLKNYIPIYALPSRNIRLK